MGEIVTFYSYKGGVGRSMALANVAILLNKWGYSVLAVNWDLDAPGLEYYFRRYLGDLEPVEQREGIIDILGRIEGSKRQVAESVLPKQADGIVQILDKLPPQTEAVGYANWRECVIRFTAENLDNKLNLITAGKGDADYFARVRDLDLEALYAEKGGGLAVEAIRNEWKREYDFVLVDSRTGITDVGGVCTVQLPDVLALVFTANTQSLVGTTDVLKKVKNARQKLPFDRVGLLCIPIASKFDTREEFNLSQEWLTRFSKQLPGAYARLAAYKRRGSLVLGDLKGAVLDLLQFRRKATGNRARHYRSDRSWICIRDLVCLNRPQAAVHRPSDEESG